MAQFETKFLRDDAVTSAKVRLTNNLGLRSRNAADSADIELFKLDTSDILQFLSHPQISTSASGDNDVLTLKDLNQELEGLKPKEACLVSAQAALETQYDRPGSGGSRSISEAAHTWGRAHDIRDAAAPEAARGRGDRWRPARGCPQERS